MLIFFPQFKQYVLLLRSKKGKGIHMRTPTRASRRPQDIILVNWQLSFSLFSYHILPHLLQSKHKQPSLPPGPGLTVLGSLWRGWKGRACEAFPSRADLPHSAPCPPRGPDGAADGRTGHVNYSAQPWAQLQRRRQEGRETGTEWGRRLYPGPTHLLTITVSYKEREKKIKFFSPTPSSVLRAKLLCGRAVIISLGASSKMRTSHKFLMIRPQLKDKYNLNSP